MIICTPLFEENTFWEKAFEHRNLHRKHWTRAIINHLSVTVRQTEQTDPWSVSPESCWTPDRPRMHPDLRGSSQVAAAGPNVREDGQRTQRVLPVEK